MHYDGDRSAFTLIELLVVIAIIAILAVVVVLTLNPIELLRQSRDSNRVSDMSTLTSALGDYNTDQSGSASFNMGSSSVVYVSIADPTATSSAGDQCQGLGLISLPGAYTYHCSSTSTYRNVNGTGWIPVNFQNMSTGAPLGSLPVDPTNNSSTRFYYTYMTNGTQYEVTSPMESAKYQVGGSSDVISGDGGLLATVYEKGSKLGLEPLDYGDSTLQGYWPLNEGVGGIAYDDSGNNATGSWNGAQIGSNGYYTNNAKIGSYAGDFDGTSTYVFVPSNPIPKTISAWIKTSQVSTREELWGGNAFFNIQPTGQLCTYNGSVYTCSSNGAITTSTWNFVAATTNGSAIMLYVNGSQVASGSGSFFGYTGGVIGQCQACGNMFFFNGFISDVRVYSRALSAAQITAMYNGGK